MNLPDLPEGYRWKYFYSYFDSARKLRLQRRILGFWIPQDTHFIIGTDDEDKYLLRAAESMKRSLEYKTREKTSNKFGVYETKRSDR